MVLAAQRLHGGNPLGCRTGTPVRDIIVHCGVRQLSLRYDPLKHVLILSHTAAK
jgi:hypothetical protein